MEGLNPDQIVFLDNILKDHSTEYVEYVVELMKNGYSNQQAKEKADKDKNV
jgi:phosphotransacetylase